MDGNNKILAVIPARAGSKGIPNKNIRILNGRPMVYYAIKNAIESNYISDVVVTTDSPMVEILARQMNVDTRWRAAELCKDDVTLDSVVYDAIPNDVDWDYIVTLQPTSPTLSKESLDKAIRYCIENDDDTVVSVINRPHLSWVNEGERIIPAYKERCNRQYLPNRFEETGAFVISKWGVVTKNTRFGNKVDVFCLPENEAHDIDTFEDFMVASEVIKKSKVAIYVNGNNLRGMGHVYRCLEIADELSVKPDIIFDNNQTNPSIFGNTTHTIIPVNSISELYDMCKEKKYTIFMNDILDTSLDYMLGLKTVLPNAKLVNFEDEGEGASVADIVINDLLERKSAENVFSGVKYYIVNKIFLCYSPIKIKEKVERVFVCFGGADPLNYTERILEMISGQEYADYSFCIAVGRAKNNVEELMKYNIKENIKVVYDVDNMPELMTSCDMAVVSRGRTACELALLGIPSIVVSENERERNHNFACNENGFSYIGLDPSNEIIKNSLNMYLNLSKESRSQLQKKLLSHDLKNGRKNVMNLIKSL